MCTAAGPGSASLAQSWASAHGLTDVHCWGDTTDYVYANFAAQPPISGNYPSVMVVELDTMTLRHIATGGLGTAGTHVADILANVDDCAELP